jgi:hypothetical protein
MLHTTTAIQYRDGSLGISPPGIVTQSEVRTSEQTAARLAAERALDEILADSFPASDPPSWNPGLARPEPLDDLARLEPLEASTAYIEDVAVPGDGMAVSWGSNERRTLIQAFVSLTGAAGIGLLVPFAILLVGVPIALFVRGLTEAINWLFSLNLL